jgi:hypothetical protein
MSLLGIAVAYLASDQVSSLVNPPIFTYLGNGYAETDCEVSIDMEHKINASYLYDFSGHNPSRGLKVPDSLTSTFGKYGRSYLWAFPRNLPIIVTDMGILAESFSIECWLNPELSSTAGEIVSWAGITDRASRRLLVAPNGSAWAQMTDPEMSFFSNAALGLGSWTHVAFVYDSDPGTVSWIVNGTLDKTSEPGYISSWNGSFRIGGWTDADIYRWNGKIDELRIRYTTLTPQEVIDDMDRPIQKNLTIKGLTPDEDKAILAVTGGWIPDEETANVNGDVSFETFEYGDQFDGRFTIFHNGVTIQSASLSLFTGDEYKFSSTFYLNPNYVFILIAIAFPLVAAIAYFAKRRATKKNPSELLFQE